MKNSKAILQVPGTMKIISAEIPVPKEDEVLIKVEYVGICGSDVHGFESGPFIPPKDPNQEIGLGHECAGTVVAVGSRVRKFKAGDRVNIEPGVPCGHCRYCLEGKYNICPDVDFMATQPNYRGALTHYLCHPESFTYKLPDNMDTMEGALVEPAAVGMHAAMLADVKPGKKIIILGAGCIGLMTLQACKCLGATDIAVVDVLEKRLTMAEQLGATVVINGAKEDTIARCQQFTEEMGADIVFETAGSAVTVKRTLFSLSICCSTSRSWLSAPAICPFPANHRGDSIKYLPERNQANSMPIPPSRNIIRQLKKAITTTPIAADNMGDQLPTNESRADHFPRTVAGINSVNEA